MNSPADDRERWNRRHADAGGATRGPAAQVTELDAQLPRRGRALDVAGGRGRHALWLAARGLDVTLADVSDVALAAAQASAEARGLRLRTARCDLERHGPPPGDYDLVVVSDFLYRPLLSQLADRLAPGGLLLVVHPTRRNLQQHAQPSARFLLDEGELSRLIDAIDGLQVLLADERWRSDSRHVARVLARRTD